MGVIEKINNFTDKYYFSFSSIVAAIIGTLLLIAITTDSQIPTGFAFVLSIIVLGFTGNAKYRRKVSCKPE